MGFQCCVPVYEVGIVPLVCLRLEPWRLRLMHRARPTCLRYIDPTLEHDLTSQNKPWALSPLISTMPHFAHRRIEESDAPPEFPPRDSLKDDNSWLAEAVEDPTERTQMSPQLARIKTADQRRAHFASKNARKSITFGPNVCPSRCRDSPSVSYEQQNLRFYGPT